MARNARLRACFYGRRGRSISGADPARPQGQSKPCDLDSEQHAPGNGSQQGESQAGPA